MSINTPPVPKYYQVAAALKALIAQGKLQPGDQIPTEESLVKSHGVSRGTVRKALQLLIDENLVESTQGRGSFVTDQAKKSTYFSLTSFEDEMRRQQRTPSTELLRFNVREAGLEFGERLQIRPSEMVYEIERLRAWKWASPKPAICGRWVTTIT